MVVPVTTDEAITEFTASAAEAIPDVIENTLCASGKTPDTTKNMSDTSKTALDTTDDETDTTDDETDTTDDETDTTKEKVGINEDQPDATKDEIDATRDESEGNTNDLDADKDLPKSIDAKQNAMERALFTTQDGLDFESRLNVTEGRQEVAEKKVSTMDREIQVMGYKQAAMRDSNEVGLSAKGAEDLQSF